MAEEFGESVSSERIEPRGWKAGPLDPAAIVRHLTHELRQPLSTIESIGYYLQMVLPTSDTKARHQLGKLQQAIEQASWILSDAVHFLQSSPPKPELVDLDEMVSGAVSDFLRGHPVWVDVDLAQAPTLVEVDPDHFRHLLRTLLYFFRRVTHAGKRIAVRTRASDEGVSVELETAEVPYTAQDIEMMFDPFGSHLPAGSGLALASVVRITESHGGRLECRLDGGDRLTVRVILPAAG